MKRGSYRITPVAIFAVLISINIYEPAYTQTATTMPVGDSIAQNASPGHKTFLWNHLINDIDFVGAKNDTGINQWYQISTLAPDTISRISISTIFSD